MTPVQSVRLMAGLTSLPKGKKNVGLLLLSHLFPQTTGVFAGLFFFFFLNEVVQGRDLETGGVGPLGNQKVV